MYTTSGYLPPASAAVILACSESATAPICASTFTSVWVRLNSSARLLMTLPADWFCPCQKMMVTGPEGFLLPVEEPLPPPPPHAARTSAVAAVVARIARLLSRLLTRAPRDRGRRGSPIARGCAAGRDRAHGPQPGRRRCAGRGRARPADRARR